MVNPRLFTLESGLCLLTRLQDLRRLAIYTDFDQSCARQDYIEGALNWIQPGWPSHSRLPPSMPVIPEPTSARRLANAISSVFRHGLHNKKNNLKPFIDYMIESQKLTENGDQKGHPSPDPWSSKVNRSAQDLEALRRLLKTVKYQTDYRPAPEVPIVDGLEDMRHCGSYLDLEACLESQLFRCQEQQKALKTATGMSTSLSPQGGRPWLRMERLTLSYAKCCGKEGGILDQVEQVQHDLRVLRPDIMIVVQASQNSHLLLDL